MVCLYVRRLLELCTAISAVHPTDPGSSDLMVCGSDVTSDLIRYDPTDPIRAVAVVRAECASGASGAGSVECGAYLADIGGRDHQHACAVSRRKERRDVVRAL